MLSPYRVLDLTDERGLACGTVLADLGADVVQIEPPGGSSARRLGPFFKGDPDPEHSLYWLAYARNKRGIALDLDSAEGRDALLGLVAGADFLIESGGPGAMESRGLGYEDLAATNPGLVYVSITPFGRQGPKADYAATDLIVQAASGALILNGDPDRPPLRAGGISAWVYAGIEAAGAALVAHHERVRSGRGQRVDVSALLSTNLAAAFTLLSAQIGAGAPHRAGGALAVGPLRMPLVWPAADGFVSLTVIFGGPGGAFLKRLFDWMHAEGELDAEAAERDWGTYLGRVLAGQEDRGAFDDLLERIGAFMRTRTKSELLAAAVERSVLLVPVSTIEDTLASPQLAARDFWREHEHAHLGATVQVPGPFVSFSRTPVRYRQRAPRIGEHTDEVLAESRPRASGTPDGSGPDAAPLAGVKILDFMWVMAGPHATRVLADYGATIVKVESAERLDLVRVLGPFYDGQPGPENSASFSSLNAGKRSLSLDLRTEEGREVVRDLVRWCDVVTESFSPKGMKGLGLDYEALRAIKPDVIMLSTCLFGQTGPLAGMAGYGTMGAAVAGIVQPTGWPDRPPCGPFGPYTDWLAPRFTVPALLAALDHRRRTGEGQYIDQAQAESATHFMAPALLDGAVNGSGLDRVANTDPQMSPHGVYATSGDDEWVAIAVRDADDWRALCRVLGRQDWLEDDVSATLEGRRAHATEIDQYLGAWTSARTAADAERLLQGEGVPAHAVVHAGSVGDEPQFRGHFLRAPHAIHGAALIESTRYALSRTPARVERAGPTLGQDTDWVLGELLGYDAARIGALREAGALGKGES